jgi:hypothetical protein
MTSVGIAGLRLAIGLGLIGSVIWQVTDRIANNVFRPTEYFAYFSIVTAILAGVVSIYAASVLLRKLPESKFLNLARLSLVVAMIVVGVVYHALLADAVANASDAGYAWPVLPNEIIHTYAPIAIVLDYLVSQRSPALRLRAANWVLVLPLAWLAFSIVRGLLTDWWPYWFINPNGEGGIVGMVSYILGIAFFFAVLGFLVHGARLALGKLSGPKVLA